MRTGPGRPKLPAYLKPVEFTVRIRPAAYDTAWKLAALEGLSTNAYVQRTLERIFTRHTIQQRADSWYDALQATPSTLTAMVSDSSTDGRCGPQSDYCGGVIARAADDQDRC